MRTKHRQALGKAGEALAASLVHKEGLRILERNWRDGKRGEIDLIAADDAHGLIAVIEVKTRIGTLFGTPLESVDERKLHQMRLLAAAWLAASGIHGTVRFDVVAVSVPLRALTMVHDRASRGPIDVHSVAEILEIAGSSLDWVQGVHS